MDRPCAYALFSTYLCPAIVDAIQPLDLLVVIKMASYPEAPPSVRKLGEDLDIPKSTIATSLRRLRDVGLVRGAKSVPEVNRVALHDCLEHAARWIAPAKIGDFELGLPTAHAAPVMAEKLVGGDDPVVMPLAHGPMRGRAVAPLHPAAPKAAAKDPKLHALLALTDAFRVGRARDRELASKQLRALL